MIFWFIKVQFFGQEHLIPTFQTVSLINVRQLPVLDTHNNEGQFSTLLRTFLVSINMGTEKQALCPRTSNAQCFPSMRAHIGKYVSFSYVCGEWKRMKRRLSTRTQVASLSARWSSWETLKLTSTELDSATLYFSIFYFPRPSGRQCHPIERKPTRWEICARGITQFARPEKGETLGVHANKLDAAQKDSAKVEFSELMGKWARRIFILYVLVTLEIATQWGKRLGDTIRYSPCHPHSRYHTEKIEHTFRAGI